MPHSVTLSIAYWPSIYYLQQVINHNEVLIEAHEYFVKQTSRNRCEIATANGKLTLSIPLAKHSRKQLITEQKISYAENWQQKHWRSMVSAYKNSPYFEFFEDEFRPFYDMRYESLFDYNLSLLQTILKLLKQKKEIACTKEYLIKPHHTNDLRNLSHSSTIPPSYYQVFANKLGFIPHLSCMDAIFNIGLKTNELLTLH